MCKFPDQGSRYKLAFSDIDAFIAKSDMVINDILQLNVRWCMVMAKINRNSQCFLSTGTVDMEQQCNYRILLKPRSLNQFIQVFWTIIQSMCNRGLQNGSLSGDRVELLPAQCIML